MVKHKIKSKEKIKEVLKYIDGTIVFTNGCFDILHQGHIHYLLNAKNYGDYLIVGLNSDKSIRKIKGENRPIIKEGARSEIIASLYFVNAVILFDEETPLELIKYIQPDILVKGKDWEEKDIVGADFVNATGGKVVRISFDVEISTSTIINNILDIYKGKE